MFIGDLSGHPPDCRARTELTHDLGVLGRLRATAAAGLRENKFAVSGGLGIDLLRFERACRRGGGMFAEQPVLRTSFGPWFDVAWTKGDRLNMRGALQFSFGKTDRALLSLPLWEVFAIAGVSHADHTAASFSLGGRYFVIQGEGRIDVAANQPTTFFMLFGLHADLGAYYR